MKEKEETKDQPIEERASSHHQGCHQDYVRDATINKRTQVEESLRKSEERFRNLVETTSDWIWEVDENAVYTYVSPQIRRILGYEPEEVIGKTPFDLMPPDEGRRVAELFGLSVSAQKAFAELENTNFHKDGHLVVLWKPVEYHFLIRRVNFGVIEV